MFDLVGQEVQELQPNLEKIIIFINKLLHKKIIVKKKLLQSDGISVKPSGSQCSLISPFGPGSPIAPAKTKPITL